MEQNTSIIFTSCKTNTNIVKCHSELAGDLLKPSHRNMMKF